MNVSRRIHLTLVIVVALRDMGTATHSTAAIFRTSNGLQLSADLPISIAAVHLDKHPISQTRGGLSLIDPRTGAEPAAGRFTLTAQTQRQKERIIFSGVVTAKGDEETVCQLQARIPAGDEGWLWWDDMSRSRVIRKGEVFVQSVYPLCCVTDPARQLGIAVTLDPNPLQPATLSYDPNLKCIIVNWFFGFSPLASPMYRMRAPFRVEIYRTLPGWAFRAALDRYYRFHPRQFDWRARLEGVWLFASPSESLPNPQHYAYNEGGPPPTPDLPRGLGTFPYSCTGDIIVTLPIEWGVPKKYEEMLDRFKRWETIPRLTGWEPLTNYEVDTTIRYTGERSLKISVNTPEQMQQIRQTFDLNQKRIDPVTVSVWFKAENVTGKKDANCGLWVDMAMSDGENQFGRVAPGDVGTHDWQELKITVGTDKPIANLRAYLLLRYGHTGTVWFDAFSLTTVSEPKKNLANNGDFESLERPWQSQMIHDNVMYDENDRMRYFADTWGGADVPPASPINWLRFILLVNPDQRNPENRPTASSRDFEMYDKIFQEWPQCAGAYLDGTSGNSATSFDYRREHFHCAAGPLQYIGSTFRPCMSAMASMIRWVEVFKKRYPGKLAFGNVWASNRMFPMCMALDVLGFESSKWYDLEHMDYYRAATCRKPGLLLNYFRIGQQLDTREGGEKFFRYATAYGLFPSIGRFTNEAYEKFSDLQHLYVPIVKHLFRAGWEPITHATANDPMVRVQRFGTSLPMYLTVLNPTPAPRETDLHIDTRALKLNESALAVVEMVNSASLALERTNQNLKTRITLGPHDVAVIVLLSPKTVGAWYCTRAAEILQGAAYVYAQTLPTVEAASLAKRLRAMRSTGLVSIAKDVDAVKHDISRLRTEGAKLHDDLKRKSYLRELAEAERLLNEALLADAGGQIGWKEDRVAAVDGQVRLVAEKLSDVHEITLKTRATVAGRLIDFESVEEKIVRGDSARVESGLACPIERARTAVVDISFRDASGKQVTLSRLGHAFFGHICELTGHASDDSRQLRLHFRNSDTRPRAYTISLTAPEGIALNPSSLRLSLAAGESKDLVIHITCAPGLESGSYPVHVIARTDAGVIAEQIDIPILYVLALEPGNLALADRGVSVSVDCSYYAYNEAPLTDGIVNPVGQAFNTAAWASCENQQEHWVEIQWQQLQTVRRVVVYWNIENDVVWTSRHFLVQVKDEEHWKTVADSRQQNIEPVTECRFAPIQTKAVRILQPKGKGPVARPNILWLREVAVY